MGNPYKQKLIELAAQIEQINAQIIILEKAISEKESFLFNVESSTNSGLSQLMERRENILANIVVGTSNQSELDEIDKAIVKEQARVEKLVGTQKTQIADATQALSGLRRRHEEAETELIEAENLRYMTQLQFLTAEAEQAGTDYLQTANDLVAKYRRLLAFEQILASRQRGLSICTNKPQPLIIPVFNLNAHKGSESPDNRNILHESVKSDQVNCIAAVVRAEMDRFQNDGVIL